MPPLPKFVFSMLHSESVMVMQFCINNFLMYANAEDVLIINSTNPDAQNFQPPADNILIVKGSPRKAHGDTLLKGHIHNWQVAKEHFGDAEKDFIFITNASNALFFRHYDKKQVLDTMEIKPTQHISTCKGWQYSTIKKSPSFLANFGKQYQHCQIEGFTAWSGAWAAIEAKLAALDYPSHNFKRDVCLEEIVPLPALEEGNHPSTNIGHVRWSKYKQGRQFTTLHDMFVAPNQPEHVCIYKWFERDDNALVTASVSAPKLAQLFSDFYNAPKIKNASKAEKIGLARSFLDDIAPPQSVLSYANQHWQHKIDASLSRQVIRLNEGLASSPYLYFEAIPEGYQAELEIKISDNRIFVKSSSSNFTDVPNKSSYFKLHLYVALYLMVPNEADEVWLTDWCDESRLTAQGTHDKASSLSNHDMVLNLSMLETDGKYERVFAKENSFGSNMLKPFSLYEMPKLYAKRVRCIGVPIIPNTAFSFVVRAK